MPTLALPPGMLALSTGLTGSAGDDRPGRSESNNEEWAENAETFHGGGFETFQDAHDFLDAEVAPRLTQPGNFRMEHRGGTWHIMHPRRALEREWHSATDGMPAQHEPVAEVESQNVEPNYHDPAYPKVIAWHNDIAYTVPVHPQALSKEHMQALADYEVHRRQHEKLESQLHGEHDEYGDRPWVVSEAAQQRLDRSQQQLNRLRDLAQGAGHVAVGTINPYYRYARKTFYQGVRQGSLRQYRGQVLPDRDAAAESMPGGEIEEFPGIWSIVNHRGRVVWSGLSSHPYYSNFGDPGSRERIMADARNKLLVARRLSHSFGDPPEIDMSKLPIQTYGKTRTRTDPWFSNLPPGMLRLDRDKGQVSSGRSMSDAKQ